MPADVTFGSQFPVRGSQPFHFHSKFIAREHIFLNEIASQPAEKRKNNTKYDKITRPVSLIDRNVVFTHLKVDLLFYQKKVSLIRNSHVHDLRQTT